MTGQHSDESAADTMNVVARSPIHFGPFLVTPQVFFITPLSFALVNIKPLLPGHVLVCPIRRIQRLSDLTPAETTNLFLTVRRVSRMVERVYEATSLNVAIQDGVHAGQSVPHVHAHIIPRKKADLDHMGGSDAIYGMMDGEDGDIGRFLAERKLAMESKRSRSEFPAVDNDSREPRSDQEMLKEAEMLAAEMEKEIELEIENSKNVFDE
ncbi:Dinucleoside triphosphate hydrolase [Microsporum canis]|uniref:Bis(5'-adenosyl)-triphosphatase n=1 Tax=Arthroderma otae (strain ATCC MYA-4605 / CBS 113480) TaxID=554155 RepID=C5FG46_ARTOC|nr:HIT domain-containing protein [Microsporum canis CBS 113480]EEQ29731.1 HIT domain-containing protein [Microsporum canis CBS 113480]